MSAVLLDTCAILWLAAGLAPREGVIELIEAARADDAALVSPISAWEIAQKEKKRPGASASPPRRSRSSSGWPASPGCGWRR